MWLRTTKTSGPYNEVCNQVKEGLYEEEVNFMCGDNFGLLLFVHPR